MGLPVNAIHDIKNFLAKPRSILRIAEKAAHCLHAFLLFI
jgi:hypothetical protein